MAVVYVFYGLAAYVAHIWLVARETEQPVDDITKHRGEKTLLQLIWLGAIVAGIVYVLTPSLLSRDAAVYAGYGRVIVAYHANPYYTPLSAFPHDALFQLDDWHDAVAAYGPVWLIVCALSTLIAGSSILHYIFFYRILGLCAHLLTIVLVITIFRTLRCSPRIVVLGSLLYAWNPLVLLESCLGGHNDTEMMLCVVAGVLLSLRAERDSFTHARYYLPPIIAFMCAALIKFTAAPFIALYLVLLIFHGPQNVSSLAQQKRAWFAIIRRSGGAALMSIVLIVILYIPLWLGHTPREIVASLGSPPSSHLAFGSILLALQRVGPTFHTASGLLAFFSLHSTWNGINALIVLSAFGLGVWWLLRVPTTLTMVRAALALLGALLIVTPWFFPWYVLWLVSLAAITLAMRHERITIALVGGTLAFSWSALFVYLFRGYPPIGGWVGFTSLTTIGPPLVIFLFVLLTIPKGSFHKQPSNIESVNQPAQ